MTPQESSEHPHEHKRKLDRHLAGGLAWTAGAKWATQFVSWTSLVVLLKLLSPADYGIGGMAGIYFNLTNMLAEFGVGTAVLHMPELSRGTLGQLHAFSVLLCSAIFGLSILAAPFIAIFFHTPVLKTVIVVGALGLFITGFQAVPTGLMQRDMDFRRLSLAEAAQAVAQALSSVFFAWLGWGYWALVVGGLVGKISNAILISIWKPVPFFLPRWKDIQAPIEMGRQTAVGRLAWSVYNYSDGMIVGRILGDAVLGYYQVAMNLASAPADKVSTLLMRTAGPLFANVQSDLVLVRRYYLIFVEALSLAVIPLMAGLIMVAPLAVPVIFNNKWNPAVVALQLLAAFMILRTLETLADQVLISQRATKFTMRMSLLNLFVMPVAFYVGAHYYGTVGVAASWIVMTPLTILPTQFILLRRIKIPFLGFMATLWPAFLSSAAMVAGIWGLQHWLASMHWYDAVKLTVEIVGGGAVYVLLLLLLFRHKLLRYVNFIRDLRSGKEVRPEPLLT